MLVSRCFVRWRSMLSLRVRRVCYQFDIGAVSIDKHSRSFAIYEDVMLH